MRITRNNPQLHILLTFFFLSLSSIGQVVDRISSAEIINPNPVGSGARAMGQANAFIAVADDATAASWNPAGLLQLEKPEISFALETLHITNEINTSTHPESEGSDFFHIEDFNYASFVYPFHWGTNMVVSLSYLKVFRFVNEGRFSFRSMSNFMGLAQSRDQVLDLDQDGSFSVMAPAFGLDVTNNLSLGLTLNIWNHGITHSSEFEAREFTSGTRTFIVPGSPVQTIPIEVLFQNRFEVDEGYSVVIGGLYRLNDRWNFGVVLKPKFDLELEQRLWTSVLTAFGPEPDFEELDAELDMPTIIGGGVAWRPNDTLSISLDLTWTEWSDYTFREGGVTKDPISGRRSNVGKLEDTFTARIGGEYLLVRDKYIVPFRCGFGYDPAPAVDDIDNFYTLNAGTGVQLGPYNFDIAYEFRWGNNVNRHFLEILDATQDVRRHRVLASLIYYF